MPRLDITISDELNDWLEKKNSSRFDSKSEAVSYYLEIAKQIDEFDHPIDYYKNCPEKIDDLETEVQHAKAKRDELRRQLQVRNRQIEELRDCDSILDRIRWIIRGNG